MSDHVIVRMRRKDYEHIKALGVEVTEITPHQEFGGTPPVEASAVKVRSWQEVQRAAPGGNRALLFETLGVDIQHRNRAQDADATRKELEHRRAQPSKHPF